MFQRNHMKIFGWLVLLIIAIQGPALADLILDTKNEFNPTANRLEGTWTISKDLSIKLQSEKRIENGRKELHEVTFVRDETVFPTEVLKKLSARMGGRDWPIYWMGTMEFGEMKVPGYLTHVSGSPHFMFFLPRNGDKFGNGESAYLNVILGKTRAQDLLFIGGDFPKEAYLGFSRKGK